LFIFWQHFFNFCYKNIYFTLILSYIFVIFHNKIQVKIFAFFHFIHFIQKKLFCFYRYCYFFNIYFLSKLPFSFQIRICSFFCRISRIPLCFHCDYKSFSQKNTKGASRKMHPLPTDICFRTIRTDYFVSINIKLMFIYYTNIFILFYYSRTS